MSDFLKNLKFMDQVRTKIGIGNVFGKSSDRTHIIVAFKRSELTEEYLRDHTVLGNTIDIWVPVEDIYEVTDQETMPLPKRIVPLKIKRRKKNGVLTGTTKVK